MIPAHGAALPHIDPATRFNIDSTPGAPSQAYAQVSKPQPMGDHQFKDNKLIAFASPRAAVVPQRLVALDGRYGLPPTAEMNSFVGGNSAYVNATRLPTINSAQSILQFGSPNSTSANIETREAKVACLVVQQQVGHIVTVKSPGAPDILPEQGFDHKVPAEGGPLEASMKPGKSFGTGPAPLNFSVTLPDGARETAEGVGLWQLELSADTPIESLATTMKALYDESCETTIAFGCQSGSARSGAVATLYLQRATAEQLAKEGRPVTQDQLMSAAQDWMMKGKELRSQHYGEKMPAGALESHAALLEREFATHDAPAVPTKLAESQASPRALPPVATKPSPPAVALKPGFKPAPPPVAAKPTPPATALKPGLKPAAPPVAAKPVPPTVALKPTPSEAASPDMAAQSRGTEDIYSVAQVRKSWEDKRPVAKVGPFQQAESTYATLHQGGSGGLKGADTPDHVYGDASASDVLSGGGTYANMARDVVNLRLAEGVANRPKAGGDYEDPWDHKRLMRASVHVARQVQEAPQSPHGSKPSAAAGQVWQAWASNDHPHHAELSAFLKTVVDDFCAPAPRGLHLFRDGKTYGAGKAVENVKAQATSSKWSPLAVALHDSAEKAANAGDPQGTEMTRMLRAGIDQIFDELPKAQQKKLVDRTQSRGALPMQLRLAQDELTKIRAQLDQPGHDVGALKDQMLGTGMTCMALRALHEVGQGRRA